jgi:hypothetical protein
MAKMTKEKSEHDVTFAKGGNTKMFPQQYAAEQEEGETGHDTSGSGGKFATGGSGKMFGFTGSQPAKSGQTGAR